MKQFFKSILSFFWTMVKFLWTIITKVFKKYPELLSIPSAFAVWVFSIPILRRADPTSGIFDAGVFQIPIFAVLQLFVYVSIAWLLLRLVFGTVQKFLKNDLKTSFNELTPWQKIILSYGLFFSLVFALVALSYTLH